jgi:hypothetical protein
MPIGRWRACQDPLQFSRWVSGIAAFDFPCRRACTATTRVESRIQQIEGDHVTTLNHAPRSMISLQRLPVPAKS